MSSSILIGIAGNSCTGKTRLCNLIQELFGEENVLIFPGDNYHIAERGDPLWDTTTHLDPLANLLDDYAKDLGALKCGKTVERREYLHNNGRFGEYKTFAPKPVIVTDGLHTFYTSGLRSHIDISIFFEIDEGVRQQLKIERDVKVRGYTPSKAREQIERRIPDAERYIIPQKKHADIAFIFSADHTDPSSVSMQDHSSLKLIFERITASSLVEATLKTLSQHAFLQNGYHNGSSHSQVNINETVLAMPAEQFARLAKHLHSGLLPVPALKVWQDGINGFMQLLVFLLILEHVRLMRNSA